MNMVYDLLFKRFREWDLQTINPLSKTCIRFESDVTINSMFKTGFLVAKKCYSLLFLLFCLIFVRKNLTRRYDFVCSMLYLVDMTSEISLRHCACNY